MTNKRFFSAVTIDDNGCWNSPFDRSAKYARIWCAGRHMLAHHYAWIVAYGEIPDGMCVLHHCDNPKCVNPKHLFLGTNQDNVNDKMKKGRHKTLKGTKHPNAKLNNHQILMIKKALRSRISQRKIAEIYNVSQGTITKINQGISYKEVF